MSLSSELIPSFPKWSNKLSSYFHAPKSWASSSVLKSIICLTISCLHANFYEELNLVYHRNTRMTWLRALCLVLARTIVPFSCFSSFIHCSTSSRPSIPPSSLTFGQASLHPALARSNCNFTRSRMYMFDRSGSSFHAGLPFCSQMRSSLSHDSHHFLIIVVQSCCPFIPFFHCLWHNW